MRTQNKIPTLLQLNHAGMDARAAIYDKLLWSWFIPMWEAIVHAINWTAELPIKAHNEYYRNKLIHQKLEALTDPTFLDRVEAGVKHV